MSDRLTLGYRTARVDCDTPVAPAGTELRGHEFHYSELDPPGDALAMSGRNGATRSGYASPRLLASYHHLHLAADPRLAFEDECRRSLARPTASQAFLPRMPVMPAREMAGLRVSVMMRSLTNSRRAESRS